MTVFRSYSGYFGENNNGVAYYEITIIDATLLQFQ